ncbi:MAG: LuxR family transcriptional regulator [Alphaproteobacteria bacterium PA4]|nr:MAG: LuxR family transcriptional regulator [Alphaproteobacteria bacterium PA4]
MTDAIHALTDKEKQALRLLTNGYDAKSMARHLGLSVHTVNERLRDARRKLATSSSREAARLLRELEGAAPEKPVDKDLGAAATPVFAAPDPNQPDAKGRPSWIGWIIGGIAMSFTLVAVALAAMTAPEAATTSPPAAAAEAAHVTAARRFLALLDADNWDASWNATGQSFKALNSVKVWTDVSTDVRKRLGVCQGREQASAEFVPAPPYGYWIVKFRARYANRPNAIETVSLMRENDEWRVVGVIID